MRLKFTILFILGLSSLNLVAQDFNAAILSACDSLAKKIIVTGKTKPKVAVVDFINQDNSVTELGVFFCRQVSSKLATKTNNQTNFKVLERSRLEQIIKEKELIKYYNNSSAMAIELGRLSVAEVSICATISEFGSYYIVDLILLDNKDGDLLNSYQMNIMKIHEFEEYNKKIIVKGRDYNTPTGVQEIPPVKPVKEIISHPPVVKTQTGDVCFSHQTGNGNQIIILLKPGNESFNCQETNGVRIFKVNGRQEVCARDIPTGLYTYIAYYGGYGYPDCDPSTVKSETIRVTGGQLDVTIQ